MSLGTIKDVVIATVDVANLNNRVYPKNVIEEAVRQRVHPIFGRVGMPEAGSSCEVDLRDVSHQVTDLRITEDGNLTGTVVVLDTPPGRLLTSLLTENLDITFRMAGYGDLIDKDGYTEVTNFRLSSINAVADGA